MAALRLMISISLGLAALTANAAIANLRLIHGEHAGCREGERKVRAEDGLIGDFNQDTGGIWIWGCITDGGLDSHPITDLAVFASGDSEAHCPSPWKKVEHTWSGGEGDLNDGGGGEFVYLCEQRNSQKAPLSDLILSDANCPDGKFRIPELGKSNGDLNQGAGGPWVYGCVSRSCIVTKMKGKWLRQAVVTFPGEYKVSVGTTKTHGESKTKEWSQSASLSLESGFEVEGLGSAKTTFTEETAKRTAETYTSEFSRTKQVERTYAIGLNDVGKQMWHFVFFPTDSCGHTEETSLDELALTAGAWEPPCCLPGWATDAPAYRVCKHSSALIHGQSGCRVNALSMAFLQQRAANTSNQELMSANNTRRQDKDSHSQNEFSTQAEAFFP